MTSQTRALKRPPSPSGAGRDAAQTALAAGGLLAAFGVASCCALPLALSLLGVSAASLVGVGYLPAQYQRELFYGSVICLSAAGVLLWLRRQSRACSPGTACSRPVLDWSNRVAMVLAVGLLALTFWIEPPV